MSSIFFGSIVAASQLHVYIAFTLPPIAYPIFFYLVTCYVTTNKVSLKVSISINQWSVDYSKDMAAPKNQISLKTFEKRVQKSFQI